MRTHCPYCDKRLGKIWHAKRRASRGASVKASLAKRKEAGLNVGRPRTLDYSAIYRLHDKGYSNRRIARELHCSHPIIARALLAKPPAQPKEE